MYERVQRQTQYYQEYGRVKSKEVWVVYDDNFRDVLFEGVSETACITWLRHQCPNGACEI